MAKSRTPAPKKPTPEEPAAPAADAAYTVVARRYRPRQFADLIGQEHVAQALTNALNSGRVAHAYLFTGARGVGKTSAARILAKALNCVTGPTATPCDECDICLSIAEGQDVDAVEIDGASNRGIDDARELRSGVGFRPQRARFKIYIIDEVHMLTKEAFNALLKTLEEPPPHVKFIFATTEVQKVPITILSRCQRFDFAAIGPAKIFATLKRIVSAEGLQADDDALHLIARRAAGSMRDAQTLLDQLLGFAADGKVTVEAVHGLLGSAEDDRVAELADAILAGDIRLALEQVATAADRGLQLGELLDQLVEYWRGLMLVRAAGPNAPDLPGTPALHDRIRTHAVRLSLDTILSGLDVLTTTKSKLRGNPHTQILLEVAVVRLAKMEELLSVAELAQWIAGGSVIESNGPASPGAGNERAAVPHPTVNNEDSGDPSKKKSLTGLGTQIDSQNGASPSGSGEDDFSFIWQNVQAALGPMLRAHLQSLELPAIIGPNSLAIRVPADYSAAYDALASETGQTSLRQSLRRVTHRDWSVRIERTAGLATDRGPATAAVEAPATMDRKQDLLQFPLFKRAHEVLGAQLVRVEEGFRPTAQPAGPPATWADPEPPADATEPDED